MPPLQGVAAYCMAVPRGRRPESILVRVVGEDGVAGWGEVTGSDVCWADIEERVGPALLGLDWDLPEEVGGVGGLGGTAAVSATDIACWDLWCRRKDSPLSHSLGGTRTSVMAGAPPGARPTPHGLLPPGQPPLAARD